MNQPMTTDELRAIGAECLTRRPLPPVHMDMEDRGRFAIEHPDVAHTPADLRNVISGLLLRIESLRNANNSQARQLIAGPGFVRYCYECGRVGEVPPGFRDCCPDGSHATYVHPEVADQARLGFLSLIEKERAAEHPEEGTHA